MRVTQRTMYNGFINNMQASLGAYMESNIQASSQKKINRPSDDPAGMALILNTRRNIDDTKQLARNVDTAEGWLNLADLTLTQVSATISQIKTLAEQAATGTMSAENRLQISMQIRQQFGQLLNLANKQFEGKSIFAGHKYDQPAFGEVLAVNTMDSSLAGVQFGVTGKTDRSIMLAFDQDVTINSSGTGIPAPPATFAYRWSDDGGLTWRPATSQTTDKNTITMGGVTLTIPNGTTLTGAVPYPPDGAGPNDGSILYIRPSAQYMGDIQGAEPYSTVTRGGPSGLLTNVQGNFDTPVLFRVRGAGADLNVAGSTLTYDYSIDNGVTWSSTKAASVPNPPDRTLTLDIPGGTITLDARTAANSFIGPPMEATVQPRRVDVMGAPPPAYLQTNVQGTYNNNVLVRVDPDPSNANINYGNLNTPGNTLYYSYSTDNGRTWVQATAQTPNPANNSLRLALPGGYMTLDVPGNAAPGVDTTLTPGTQFVIHPDRADLNYEIMKDTYVSVNSVGVNIFGGIYQGQPGLPGDQNLFEVVGKLIAYTENNNQTGVQQCLAALTTAQEKVLTEAARIGGLENRLTLAKDVLSFDKLEQQTRLSYTEDANLTELLTRLAQQQLTYNTVLQSSSMIMQLNLAKFL